MDISAALLNCTISFKDMALPVLHFFVKRLHGMILCCDPSAFQTHTAEYMPAHYAKVSHNGHSGILSAAAAKDTSFPSDNHFSSVLSIALDDIVNSVVPPSKPVSRPCTRAIIQRICKAVRQYDIDHNAIPDLGSKKAAPDKSLSFEYSIPLKGGAVFIGISNSGLSLWVHAPAPAGAGGPATTRRTRVRTGAVGRTKGTRAGRKATQSQRTNNPPDREDDNGDNGDGQPGNNGFKPWGHVQDASRSLACPFYKFDPVRYFRCYRRYGLRRFSDVKQHIQRCHSLGPLYCTNCWVSWPESEDDQFTAHISQSACLRVYEIDRLLPHEATRMNAYDATGTEPEKWYGLWELLFPNSPRPSSPYVDLEIREVISIVTDRCAPALEQQLAGLLFQAGLAPTFESIPLLSQWIHSIYTSALAQDAAARQPRYRRVTVQQPAQQQFEPQQQPNQGPTQPASQEEANDDSADLSGQGLDDFYGDATWYPN